MKRAVVVFFLALTLTGCGDVYIGSDKPESLLGALRCTSGKRLLSGTIVLMAQAVPSGSMVPCLSRAPADWVVATFDVSDGRSSIELGYEPQQDQRVTLEVVPRCDPAGATETPSGTPGVRRFDGVDMRYFQYPDACTTLRFQLSGVVKDTLAADIGDAFSFITRSEVDRRVRELSGGRLHLDAES